MQSPAAPPSAALLAAVAPDRVPGGGWAVGVSGGADSVAMLRLLHASRPDLRLVVAHLNHELRGDESDADERFVEELARSLNLPFESARAGTLGSGNLPANPSARFRRLRYVHFANIVRAHQLAGVILAHHADDQAETVLHRLLRGSGYPGLCGMSADTTLRGLRVLRPLLDVRSSTLRGYLGSCGQSWREDSSNRSEKYVRNRLRAVLRDRDELHAPLLELAARCRALRDWVQQNSPRLADEFAAAQLADLPDILARAAAARWLRGRGVPSDEISRVVIDRLLTMCTDAASPARVQFPGRLTVRRRARRVSAQRK